MRAITVTTTKEIDLGAGKIIPIGKRVEIDDKKLIIYYGAWYQYDEADREEFMSHFDFSNTRVLSES